MHTISDFQTKFPLSRKKFWKKLVSRAVKIFIVSLFVAIAAISAVVTILTDYAQQLGFGMKFLLSAYIIAVVVALVVCLLIYAVYINAYIKRYYYDSTDFITIKKGVFTPTEIHVQYQKIQDVYVDQDIWDRIFGIYDVHIASATATSGIEAHIDGVDGSVAEGLKNFILGKIQGSTTAPTVPATTSTAGTGSVQNAVNFSEEISIKNYPIDGRWYTQTFFSTLFTAILIPGFIAMWTLDQHRNGSTIYSTPGAYTFKIWLILFLVFFVGGIIRMLIWKSNFYFAFEPQFVVQKTGVISRQEKHLPYKSIQDVMIKQNLFEKLLGISTVTIQNAAQGMGGGYGRGRAVMNDSNVVIPGQPLARGQKLVEELNNVLAKRTDSMGL